MSFGRIMLLGVAASALLAAKPASAVTFTFGSFSFVGPAQVHYDNATGLFTGTSIPVNFNYNPAGVLGTPAPGYGTQSALLTFSAHSLGAAASFASLGFQNLQLDSFSLTRTTPYIGLSNLLSGNSTLGTLSGVLGGSTASYTSSMGGGASIFYQSDWLQFPPATDADLSWTLTSVNPSLAISGSNFRTFDASIAGTFGYNPQVMAAPEPGLVGMLLGAGVGGSLFLRRRTRVRA